MSLWLAPDDPRLIWQGALSLHRTASWVMPWRIPYEDRALFPPEAFVASDGQSRAAMPAGVRIVFRSDTTLVGGQLVAYPQDPQASPLDLCCDGELCASVPLAGQTEFRFDQLPAAEKLIELWLPQHGPFRLKALKLSSGASVVPFDDPRPRWVVYGSSITQCRTAPQPTQTWPAIVARARGLNLTCLGYGGNCHLEPMVARMIRDLPAELLTMKIGINIYNHGSLNLRTFRPAIIGFVQIIRERHPDTPFGVISPIYGGQRETTPNAVGLTLSVMREEIAAAVSALRTRGDRHLHCFDGLQLLGSEHAHLLPDILHPNAEGYNVVAQNFLQKVMAKLYADNPHP